MYNLFLTLLQNEVAVSVSLPHCSQHLLLSVSVFLLVFQTGQTWFCFSPSVTVDGWLDMSRKRGA